jgi:hypothetical protein
MGVEIIHSWTQARLSILSDRRNSNCRGAVGGLRKDYREAEVEPHHLAVIDNRSPGIHATQYRSRERYMPLIAQLLINDVHQWLTLLESVELRDEELHGLIQPIGCMVGTMRGHQYIFQLVEGMALG